MKICPSCQTRYTDDTLRFCLQDGTPLVAEAGERDAPTVSFKETETVVKPRPTGDAAHAAGTQPQTGYETNQDYIYAGKKSNTMKIVGVTVLTMFVIFAGIGAGAWLYFRNQNNTAKNAETPRNTQRNQKQKNENSAVNAETPTPTATPEKTPEIDAAKIRNEIAQTLNSWKNAAENLNENDYMSHYADRLDYYNKKNASIDFVRQDKVRAFTPYDDVNIGISNLNVTTDGETATAVFDKEWVFEGEEKYSDGKVQSEFKFRQFDGKWKIVSEKDLKVYYVNKE